MDLANGPLVLFILELIAFVGFIVSSILLMNKRKLIRMIPFLSILAITALFFILSKPKTEYKRATRGNTKETEVLALKNGDIKGLYTEDLDVEVYAGIPYAEAPIGDLRWKEPKAKSNWDGVLDCTKFAPNSYQAKKNSP